MKKAIIGFILAAFVLVLVSCDLSEVIKKGGTVRVTNKSNTYGVNVYITKYANTELTPPDSCEAKTTIPIPPNGTGDISVGEDGEYYINVFFYVPEVFLIPAYEKRGTIDPITSALAILRLGNVVSVDAKEIL